MEDKIFETDTNSQFHARKAYELIPPLVLLPFSVMIAIFYRSFDIPLILIIFFNLGLLIFIISIIKTYPVIVYKDRIIVVSERGVRQKEYNFDQLKYIRQVAYALALVVLKDRIFPNNFFFFNSDNKYFSLKNIFSSKNDYVVLYIKEKIDETKTGNSSYN